MNLARKTALKRSLINNGTETLLPKGMKQPTGKELRKIFKKVAKESKPADHKLDLSQE